MIFDVIGTPNEEDTSFLSDMKALSYLKSFKPRPHDNFRRRYPGARDEALVLLQKILVFNPFFRPSVEECLEHPYLKLVRQAHQE